MTQFFRDYHRMKFNVLMMDKLYQEKKEDSMKNPSSLNSDVIIEKSIIKSECIHHALEM
jgi:hypothetical protein